VVSKIFFRTHDATASWLRLHTFSQSPWRYADVSQSDLHRVLPDERHGVQNGSIGKHAL